MDSVEDVEEVQSHDSEGGVVINGATGPAAHNNDQQKPQLSKTQLKKLRRKAEWEAGREQRKVVRREKVKTKQERKREAYRANAEQSKSATAVPQHTKEISGDENVTGTSNGVDDTAAPSTTSERPPRKPQRKAPKSVQLPITIVFDCQYDELMTEGELISLASQLTRCYSDNKKALFCAHLVISSFGGRLKERFEGIMAGQHENWKGVRFVGEDFASVAEKAKGWMKESRGGTVAGALLKSKEQETDEVDTDPKAEAATEGEVVYLSSDSSETLTELRPYSTYIIGGLVDRNRHKGICYKSAVKQNVRTAKLPIGEFIEMRTRVVLATNHVSEIMLRWLEIGDWGKAFFEVIPKRKGGKLKDREEEVDSPRRSGESKELPADITEELAQDGVPESHERHNKTGEASGVVNNTDVALENMTESEKADSKRKHSEPGDISDHKRQKPDTVDEDDLLIQL